MKYSIWTLAPAHMPKMSLGVAQRSLSGMKSIPCCSTWNAILDIRLVNDRQILGNRHRQYLLVVASAEARTPRRATGGRADAPAAPRQPLRSRVHAPTCQVPARVPGERPKVCRPTHCVTAGPLVKWLFVNGA